MTDVASASFTTFESTSEVLQSILDDGTCPSHPEEGLNIFCFTDKSFMCLKCSIIHKGHHITPFSTPEEGQMIIQKVTSIIYCTKHIEKHAQYYCLKEDRPVCEMCCLVSCKSHDVEEICNLANKYKSKLAQLSSKITDTIDEKKYDLSEYFSQSDTLMTRLDTKQTEQVQKIEHFFDSLEEKLAQKRTESVDYVKSEMKKVCGDFLNLVNSTKQIQQWDIFRRKLVDSGDIEVVRYGRSRQFGELKEFVEDFDGFQEQQLEILKAEGLDQIGVLLDEEYCFKELQVRFVAGGFGRRGKEHEKIRYLRYGGPSEMFITDFDGSNQQRVTNLSCSSVTGGRQLVVSPSGDVWLYGGHDDDESLWDPSLYCVPKGSDQAIKKSQPPGIQGNTYFAFMAAPDNTLWIVGGYHYRGCSENEGEEEDYDEEEEECVYDKVFQYSIDTDEWTQQPNLDIKSYYHTGAIYNRGKRYMVYILGGYNLNTGMYLNEVRVFNYNMTESELEVGRWEKIPLESSFTYNYMSIAVPVADRNEIYLFGSGGNGSSWKFDVKTRKFMSINASSQSWSYCAYWARKDNVLAITSDTGSTVKYDISAEKVV